MDKKKISIRNNPIISYSIKFACLFAFACSSLGIVLILKRENKTQNLSFYKEAKDVFNKNEKAKLIVGEPIYFNRINFFKTENYITDSDAKVSLPLKGQNYDGVLNVNATCKNKEWTLNELTLELDKDLSEKKFIIFKKENVTK